MNTNFVNISRINPYINQNFTNNNRSFTRYYNNLPCDTVSFTGWFKRKNKDEVESKVLNDPESQNIQEPESIREPGSVSNFNDIEFSKDFNANDMILSLKLADSLHRLKGESLVVLGEPDGFATKAKIAMHFEREDSFIPNPKDIKDVYFINTKIDPIIITKGKNNNFLVYGSAKNLTHPTGTFDMYHYNNRVTYGDILHFNNGLKLKFIKTNKESNIPMYDIKYPIESFFTPGSKLEGSTVFNNTEKPKNNLDDSLKELAEVIKNNNTNSNSKLGKSIPNRTFDDVKGLDSTIERVKKKVMFPIMHPEAFPDVKTKGIIFYGEPGTGKTLISLAMIVEIKKRSNKNVHFINIDAKSLDRSEWGKSEGLWRNVFKEAKENQPSIVFIDEIDSVMETRQSGSNFVPNNSLVSQFLTIMDDIEKNNSQIWVIGATNRPERIDPAIRRSGRIGTQIEIKRPNEEGCADIFDYYTKDLIIDKNFDKNLFTKKLYDNNCTGSDIADIVANSREILYERTGIYDKMDNGTYKKSDLNNLEYIQIDFDMALQNHLDNKLKISQ